MQINIIQLSYFNCIYNDILRYAHRSENNLNFMLLQFLSVIDRPVCYEWKTRLTYREEWISSHLDMNPTEIS